MKRHRIAEHLTTAYIDEYIAAFDEGYFSLSYVGEDVNGLLSALKDRAEKDLDFRFEYARLLAKEGQEEAAHQIFLGLQEESFVPAKVALAYDAYYGYGREESKEESFRILSEVHEAGTDNQNVPFNLALHYYLGKGVEEDLEKAISLFQEALDMGNYRAGTLLIDAYRRKEEAEEGYEFPMEEYYKLLLHDAKQGNPKAMDRLIDCYAEGHHSSKDPIAAEAWRQALSRVEDPTLPLAPGGKEANPGRYVKGPQILSVGEDEMKDIFAKIGPVDNQPAPDNGEEGGIDFDEFLEKLPKSENPADVGDLDEFLASFGKEDPDEE